MGAGCRVPQANCARVVHAKEFFHMNTRLSATRCVAATALLWSTTVARAQTPSLETRLQHLLDSLAAAQGVAGATAAVSIDGNVTAVATGFADRERNALMTLSDRMLVGSAGKPFFAFVVLSLVAEGKLDLDAPISRWLGREPWFARLPNAADLTMRHLLSHRGGIPNHVGDSAFATAMRTAGEKKRQRGFSAVEQIAFVLDKPAPYRAGDGFTYTDTGYLLAALVLERVAGRTYYRELTDRVLRPLRLTGTVPSNHSDIPRLAQGYNDPPPAAGAAAMRGSRTWGLPDRMVVDGKMVINPVYEWTGGGLASTSPDLARWIETLFEKAPWKSIGDRMVNSRPSAAPYGFGIFVREASDGVVYEHPGGFPGYRTFVAYSPSLGVGVAFQANSERADGGAAARAILDLLR